MSCILDMRVVDVAGNKTNTTGISKAHQAVLLKRPTVIRQNNVILFES